jgi:hypothetical protein
MGKPSFSPKQKKRRFNAYMAMKDLFARLDMRKQKRQEQKEYKG